ncbi:hypothetical protein SLEP1_g22345 [Rubroshorea leprosula]|uniref:Transposase (putative) gypsy type domain-containing protein n=1 Tax=Rubroshorea leprosula TaxID=152421 RepID=A0AAV5J8W5_9ROSI|nr:hypothetical protein SLEP1_g22345 [Rubroshorea leprosula]
MSFEETLSIRGSEEVRMLEYSDVSVDGGSSGSERIEGGVGRNEVVEVGAEKVPVNILEVGDRNDKFYDIGANIVSEVKEYESKFRTRLRFPLPDLLMWLLLEYSVGLTQLSPNAVRVIIGFIVYCQAKGVKAPIVNMFKHFFVLKARNRKEKGWYYFTPRSSNKKKRNLFSAEPSSIKGWKQKFFFVDDTEWERGDGEVEFLSTLKANKANQNKYSLNSDEEEEVEKLVRKEGDIIDIIFLTSSDVIEAAELYGLSSMSESVFVSCVMCKPRKKSKTLEKVASGKGDGNVEKGQMSSTEVRTAKEVELRGDEVVEFVPRPVLVELDPDLKETEVPALGKGKAVVPTPSFQSSIFGNKNFSAAKNFINAYVPEVDRRKAREEALVHGGISVVRHDLETATWVNVLAQEFMGLVKEHNSLQKERDELLKKNGEMKRELDIVAPAMTSLQEERDTLKTILSFEEKKRKMCEEENEAQEEEIKRMREFKVELKKNVQLLVHNGMEEHISNSINSSSFDNIVNIYRLPTTILTFTDCRKKVKAEYPEVDITKITFSEQRGRVGGERQKHVSRFLTSAVEEEEGEAEGAEVEESQPSPPMEVHPVPFEEEQPPLPIEQEPPQSLPPVE